MKKKIAEVLHITIYIWIGIQVVLGICWGVCNFDKIPDFQETGEFLTMSATLCVDEYTGYLYPLIMRGFHELAAWISVPSCTMLYLLQLIIAYLAYDYFLQKVVFYKSWKWAVLRKRIPLYVAFFMTIPSVLQVHMAILPYSLASSLLLILVAKITGIWQEEHKIKKGDLFGIAFLWMLSAQICVDYAWIGGMVILIGIVYYMWVHKHFCWKMSLTFLVTLLLIGGLNSALQTPGSMGKIQRSPEGVLLTRMVWPKFVQMEDFWEESVKAEYSTEELLSISTYPEKVIYDFGPHMDSVLGYKEANRVYRNMIKQTIAIDTKYMLSAILKDGGAYICPPITMYLQLQGVGSSFTGWNYGRMKDYTPRLTAVYVNIALTGWICLFVSSVLLTIFSTFPKEWQAENMRKRSTRLLLYCTMVVLITDFWYVMTSGHMQDYKKVPIISVLWAIGMIAVLNRTEEKYRLR